MMRVEVRCNNCGATSATCSTTGPQPTGERLLHQLGGDRLRARADDAGTAPGATLTRARMKLLLDFLPIILFFGTFKYAEANKAWAAAFATQHLGGIVAGGVVGPDEAPVLLATVVVIVATLAQVAWLKVRGQKIDTMLWVSLGLVVVLGGATIWFHSETFIKWKPSVLYWVMALAFWISQLVFGKNLLQALMGAQLRSARPRSGSG